MIARTNEWTVGELAQQAGVSAGTLRHYHRLGILTPSRTTAAGYRLYTPRDRERLELIRALRGLDVDLAEITSLIRGAKTLRQIAELHLRTLELQLKSIGRRRAVLRVVLRDSAPPSLERLQRLQALSDYERREREIFLTAEMTRRIGALGPQRLPTEIFATALSTLPDAPTDEQVEAWLELAEMVSDPDFLSRYKTMPRGVPVQPPKSFAEWRRDTSRLYGPVVRAVEAGVRPRSDAARPIVQGWARLFRAQNMPLPSPERQRPGPRRGEPVMLDTFARHLLDHIAAHRDPSAERFWRLIAILNPSQARSPIAVAWPWLTEALTYIAERAAKATRKTAR